MTEPGFDYQLYQSLPHQTEPDARIAAIKAGGYCGNAIERDGERFVEVFDRNDNLIGAVLLEMKKAP